MITSDAKRFTHLGSVSVAAPPDRVFPLLCPVREYEWIDGWDCQLIYSESGLVEEGCIFSTHFPDDGSTLWVTTLHDPVTRRVEFVRFTPDVKILKMQLRVDEAGTSASSLTIKYTLTALSGEGNRLVDQLVSSGGSHFEKHIHRIGTLLDYFLTQGKMLNKSEFPQ
jgi:hypothetical protein